MSHVSRFKLSFSDIEQLGQRIVRASFLLKNKGELQLFFDDLLTSTEKAMLGRRLLIAMFLEKGFSYGEIRRALRVGENTISAISERLRRSGEGFRVALKKLEREEKIDHLLESLKKAWNRLPSKAGKGRWRFLHP
ncbi:MAG: hypothetical protein HYT39_01065 [Candidatus Sungbacteria bacterium]|nr:hypothetical protein [Candidatus Sungbacteria bacterium]